MAEIIETIGIIIILASMVLVPLFGFIIASRKCYLEK